KDHGMAEMRTRRPSRGRAFVRLAAILAGAITLPFRRVRRSKGLSGDAGVRREEMLALTAGVTRRIGGARLRNVFRSKAKKAEARRAALEEATKLAVEQL